METREQTMSKQEMLDYIADKLPNMVYLDIEMVYGLIIGIDGAKGKAAKV